MSDAERMKHKEFALKKQRTKKRMECKDLERFETEFIQQTTAELDELKRENDKNEQLMLQMQQSQG